MENYNMTDQLGTATLIEPEKNIETQQEDMEFSSSIQDVMSAPIDSPPMNTASEAMMMHPQIAASVAAAAAAGGNGGSKKNSGYPLNLTKEQVEALVAGVAAVIGVSGPVQEKLSDIIPSFFNEFGKLSTTGMAVTALIVAVIFFFLRQFFVKSR